MLDLVTIASGLALQDACLARAKLEGSGIYSFLANEALMHTHCPSLSFGVGGVNLRVMKHDVPAALEVLTGKAFDKGTELDAFAMEQCCPKCKSTDFTRKRSGFLMGILATFFGLPLRLTRDRKVCKHCRHKWT